MLGDFIIRLLVYVLPYIILFSVIHLFIIFFFGLLKNLIKEMSLGPNYRMHISCLMILLALISSFERVGDIFISWLPLYGEMKVVFFVYLWYPKTKGTRHVYETLLKPYIAQHETEIDRKIMELRARAWDFFIFYFHNFAQAGQSTLIQAFQYVLAQSVLFSTAAAAKQPPMEPNVNVKTRSPVETESDPHSPPAPRALNKTLSALRSLEKQTSRGRKWPPPTPGRDSAGTFNGDEGVNIPDTLPGSPITDARAKLRRSNSRSQAAS
uniref:HVA22-like protein n=1 Tax=Brassica campestris TaxID=3711 RepID=A0A3P5ZTP8_BRACM|nr:unnamed protein product [Brassica rapa]